MTQQEKFDIVLAKNIIARELKSLYKEMGITPNGIIESCFDDIEKLTGTANQPTGRDILESDINI